MTGALTRLYEVGCAFLDEGACTALASLHTPSTLSFLATAAAHASQPFWRVFCALCCLFLCLIAAETHGSSDVTCFSAWS